MVFGGSGILFSLSSSHSLSPSHTHSYMHARTHMHPHTCTHTHTHTHSHSNTHMHKHKHSLTLSLRLVCLSCIFPSVFSVAFVRGPHRKADALHRRTLYVCCSVLLHALVDRVLFVFSVGCISVCCCRFARLLCWLHLRLLLSLRLGTVMFELFTLARRNCVVCSFLFMFLSFACCLYLLFRSAIVLFVLSCLCSCRSHLSRSCVFLLVHG